MYVCVRNKESDRSCMYLSNTRRVVGHVCIFQIQGEWSIMYVCVRYKESDRSCMYVLETRRVIGHVCMC